MEIPLFKDVAVIFGLAVMILWICSRMGVPTIVGFLFTGVICGPHGLGLVEGVADVDTLAHVGIMLLLFAIGLESSMSRLLESSRFFFLGGGLQVGITVLIGFVLSLLLFLPFGESIFIGFLLSMSSTAIVLKELKAMDANDTLQGRLSLGILIFQDIIAVPMILLTPFLGSAQGAFDTAFVLQLLMGLAIIGVVFIAAIKVVPFLLYQIAKTRSRELFLLSVLAICFAVAGLAASMGLSLAIGAFLAGLIISESEFRHEAIGNILPLQEIFASLFFVSTGMLLDLSFVVQQPFLILSLAIAVLLMKGLVVAGTAWYLGLPFRIMVISGLALSQIGEFSFVLARTGQDAGIGTDYHHQLFLAVALLTMGISPSLFRASGKISNALLRYLPLSNHLRSGGTPETAPKIKNKEHVVIIGFGIAGKNLARAAKESNLPYSILETNPVTVKVQKAKGEPICFGDATHEEVLHHVCIAEAKAIAIMINDPQAVRQIVPLVRKLNPTAYLIVRTRYMQEMPLMTQLGADDVIPDEFGTSVEMFTRVLQRYNVPVDTIHTFATGLRSEGYEMLR